MTLVRPHVALFLAVARHLAMSSHLHMPRCCAPHPLHCWYVFFLFLSFFLSFLLTSSFAVESPHSTTLLADGHTLSLEGPPWSHHRPRRRVDGNDVWRGQDVMLMRSYIALCLAVARHLAVSSHLHAPPRRAPPRRMCHVARPSSPHAPRCRAPRGCACHLAVLLDHTHCIAGLLAPAYVLLVRFSFSFFFLSTTSCGPVTTLPHHALC